MTALFRRPAIVLGLLAAAVLVAVGFLTACNERGARPVTTGVPTEVVHTSSLDTPIPAPGEPLGSTLGIGQIDTTNTDPPAAHVADNDSSPGALPTTSSAAPPAEPEPAPETDGVTHAAPGENAPPPPPVPSQEPAAPPPPLCYEPVMCGGSSR
jgi:hypothetical protein